jgi:hypothetical protein
VLFPSQTSWLGKRTRCGGLNQLAWEKRKMWWVKPAGLGKERCGGLNQMAWEKHKMWWVKAAGLGKARDVVG